MRFAGHVVDLRGVGSPARGWLERARPTRGTGTGDPEALGAIALARSHGVLIRLHRVEVARLRDR